VIIDIGTPSEPFPVALDTGSGDLDIPLSSCATCIKTAPNNGYDLSRSSTGSKACPSGCTFSNSYETCDLSDPTAICTISGNFYKDQASLAGLNSVPVVFGGINFQTSNFDQFKVIDGVVGLAGNGGGGNQDVFETLFASGQLDANEFAMCLWPGEKSNATFTLGGADSRLYTGDIMWTNNAQGDEGYNLAISAIEVGGTAVKHTQNTVAVLDSGTNILLLVENQYEALEEIFTANCSNNPLVGICTGVGKNGTLFEGGCYDLTAAEMAAYPDINFNIDSFQLTIKPSDYLVYRDDINTKCLGILSTGTAAQGGIFIIGDTVMQEYYSIFDNTNNKIGFAPVNKQMCGNI